MRKTRSKSIWTLDNRHEIFLAHHEQFLAIDLDLGAGVLAEQHLLADLHADRADLAVFENLAVADGNDFAFDGLFGRRVGNHDAASGLGFLFQCA